MCTVAVRVEAVAAVLAVIQQQASDAFPADNHGDLSIVLNSTMMAMQVCFSALNCLRHVITQEG